MPDTLPATQSSLSFAKLVATPTETAWAQAFNAGNVFVCLSLTVEEINEDVSLSAIGKDLFTILQSEFFSLETKDTANIKKAFTTSLDSIPEIITVSLSMAYYKDARLSVFIAGKGGIIMKRQELIGVLIERQNEDREILSATGYVNHNDTVILESGTFMQIIPFDSVRNALSLNLPNDIVEALSPQMHEQDNGAQAAIVISYQGASASTSESVTNNAEQDPSGEQTISALYAQDAQDAYDEQPQIEAYPQETEHAATHPIKKFLTHLPKIPHGNFRMTHRRRLFLNIAIIIALLLGASIFLTMKKQHDDHQQTIFKAIYPPAQQYYETGQGLETLNPELSQENYQKAEKLLQDGETKLNKGTSEYQQVNTLLSKVQSSLQGGSSGQTTTATPVTPQDNSLLAIANANPNALAFGEDGNVVYIITATAVTTVSKSDGSKKVVITNDGDWSSPKAVVPYEGNIYILDPKKGVLKYTPTGSGFGKSDYFHSSKTDLSQATGMAIDGSVWILSKVGTIAKYTRGIPDELHVIGLEKSLKNPTRIVTDIGMEHVYVLDTGNSRIVQFDKHGAFQHEYLNPILSKATNFTVSEKEKTIQVLSEEKVWKLAL